MHETCNHVTTQSSPFADEDLIKTWNKLSYKTYPLSVRGKWEEIVQSALWFGTNIVKKKKRNLFTSLSNKKEKRKCIHVFQCILRISRANIWCTQIKKKKKNIYIYIYIYTAKYLFPFQGFKYLFHRLQVLPSFAQIFARRPFSRSLIFRTNVTVESYDCNIFVNIFKIFSCIVVYFLKGMALPHIRLLYLASLVLIVAKAIRHHK